MKCSTRYFRFWPRVSVTFEIMFTSPYAYSVNGLGRSFERSYEIFSSSTKYEFVEDQFRAAHSSGIGKSCQRNICTDSKIIILLKGQARVECRLW